jgi:hypothetical protein
MFYLAWIASKVKAATPVSPSGGATTAIPSVTNALLKGSGGSMAISSGDKPSTRRRAHSRKKPTTTTLPTVVNPVTSSNDDEQGSKNGEEPVKAAIRRVVRTLVDSHI